MPSGTYKREDWCSDCHIEFRGLIAETAPPISQQLRVPFMRTVDRRRAVPKKPDMKAIVVLRVLL